jgi:1-acyl-sn-glycerol-3-phosphate acyltransferase
MLNFLPALLRGMIATLLLVLNVLFWPFIVFALSIPKLLLPFKPVRAFIDHILQWISENWISCNSGWMNLIQKTKWDVQGLEGLNYKGWYLVVSNHQSWVDIFVLQHLLNRRIPLMKFFLKHELIWVPVMGPVWWALDFPFLRRQNAEYLKKHPEQKRKDFETTRRSCEKFATMPTSVMNFLEGTRYTASKYMQQESPYKYLLRPKAGGIALALSVLGDKFNYLLNITIVYPDGIPTFWQFLCGKLKRVTVRIQKVEIPPHLLRGDYEGDEKYRTAFQQWVQDLWQEKDLQIELLHKENGAS